MTNENYRKVALMCVPFIQIITLCLRFQSEEQLIIFSLDVKNNLNYRFRVTFVKAISLRILNFIVSPLSNDLVLFRALSMHLS